MAGDTLPAAELGEHGPAEVRVFVDRSLLEVFIDGRLSVSRWLDTDAVETFELFAERGSVELDRVEVWRLEEAGNGAAP